MKSALRSASGADRVHGAGEAARRRGRAARGRRRRRGGARASTGGPTPTRPPRPRPKIGARSASAPPAPREHDREAQRDAAQPQRLGARRLGLPVDAQLGEEARAGRRRLVEELLAAVAVVADRRGADEDARALRLGEPRARAADQAARRIDAARVDALAARGGRQPAEDRLAGEVDDGARPRERRLGDVEAVPADRLGRPGRAATRVASRVRARTRSPRARSAREQRARRRGRSPPRRGPAPRVTRGSAPRPRGGEGLEHAHDAGAVERRGARSPAS